MQGCEDSRIGVRMPIGVDVTRWGCEGSSTDEGGMMGTQDDGRGILFPARLPTFHREPAPPGIEELVRWFWIPQWDIAPGRVSRQYILPFPASNLVIEEGGISLFGPTTGASHRDLRGKGWAVGALLRPAAIASLHPEPSKLQNLEMPFEAPGLHRDISAVMMSGKWSDEERLSEAVATYTAWVVENLSPPNEAGRMANEMEEFIASDRGVVRIEQVARHLGISVRAVQRLARRHIGLSPLVVIRRYRLQEAAQRLRNEPELTITQVAAALGYADHAHLTADFRRVLGFTPHNYRSNPEELR